jgi:hypothetical protein
MGGLNFAPHDLRIKPELTLAERRLVFVNRWRALMVELAA